MLALLKGLDDDEDFDQYVLNFKGNTQTQTALSTSAGVAQKYHATPEQGQAMPIILHQISQTKRSSFGMALDMLLGEEQRSVPSVVVITPQSCDLAHDEDNLY